MRVYTSNYRNCKNSKGISISGDGGKQVGFQGKRIKELAPKLSWWKVWHENIGQVPEDENLAFYIMSYYETVLKPLGIRKVMNLIPEGSVLLCYEDPEEFCHREIVAAYLELYLNQEVPEVIVDEYGKIEKVGHSKYYGDIKKYLEELIKGSIEMYGFDCIAAANMHEYALYLESHPELCDIFPVNTDSYRRLAEVLENEYKSKRI